MHDPNCITVFSVQFQFEKSTMTQTVGFNLHKTKTSSQTNVQPSHESFN